MLAHIRHQIAFLGTIASQMPYFFQNNATMSTGPNIGPTVIIGGGIIGLSSAYYLASDLNARSPNSNSENNIVVVEASSTICAGASGQN